MRPGSQITSSLPTTCSGAPGIPLQANEAFAAPQHQLVSSSSDLLFQGPQGVDCFPPEKVGGLL